SSFGVSGTNAHVVLEEAPGPTAPENACERPLHFLAISAKTQAALQQLADALATELENNPRLSLPDVCFTLNSRAAHSRRAAWPLATTDEARIRLREFSRRGTPGTDDGTILAPPKIAFVFAGGAAADADMGRELYRTQPTFRAAVDNLGDLLRPRLERSLSEVICGEDSGWRDDPVWSWSATFALEYAFAELWQAWGLRPDFVFGLGAGEYVAGCVARVFSLKDGLHLMLEQVRPAGQSIEGETTTAAPTMVFTTPRVGFVSSVTGE